MTLREYQAEAYTALRKDIADGLTCLGISLPTGTGKTHIMTELGKDGADNVAPFDGPGRVLYLLHRDTLIEQTAAKLRQYVTPGTSVGILKAERNETGAKIIVASIHSLRTEGRRAKLPPIKLVIVDEAHVSVSPTYKAVFEQLKAGQPGGPIMVGFSATWTRSDDTGLGDVWQKISYSKTIKWAVKNGHLVPPRAIQIGAAVDLVNEQLDRDGVKVLRATGDYRDKDLGKSVMLEELADSVVQAFRRHDNGTPSVLFAPTVEAAEYFGEALRSSGTAAEGLYGETPPSVRRQRFLRHREGETRVLTTCTALAEGWDCPPAGLGMLVRPTKHEGLFVQIFGRFLRPWPGKSSALLLDFVGATDNIKLRNAVDLSNSVVRDSGDGLEELLDDEEPTEPVVRERLVRQRKSSYEVEIFPGSSVQWLLGPSGIPFVPLGKGLAFIVEGRDGWHVAHTDGTWKPSGHPSGKFVYSGLPTQDDALELASEYAEEHGQYIAQKSAAWRAGAPSEGQLTFAQSLGIAEAAFMSRGALSDEISVRRASGVLNYFAHWSRSQLLMEV